MVSDLPPQVEGDEPVLEQGEFPPGDPIYVIPPIEREPEITIRADLLAEERDWGHGMLGLQELHEKGYLGEGVIVAICDTGGDPDHPDLKERFLPDGHQDYTGSRYGWRDVQGHGTHCSGIALAAKGNEVGVIGAAPAARLLIQKVLGDSGSGASSWIAAGIRRAADLNAGVISLSLGGPSPDSQTRAAIQYANSKGSWVVAAAGNDGGPASSYPGHYPETCAVAALQQNGTRASFSTVNSQNDVATPGQSILSTLPNNRYGRMSGTSMATPYVAGCLALVRGAVQKANRPMPTQEQLLAAIKETSKDIPPVGVDSGTGAGLLWTAALIDRFAGSPLPPPPPPPPPPAPVPVHTHSITGGLYPRYKAGTKELEFYDAFLKVWTVPSASAVPIPNPVAAGLINLPDIGKALRIARLVLQAIAQFEAKDWAGLAETIQKILAELGVLAEVAVPSG